MVTTVNFITMIAPWKNWCRLCANPYGGIPMSNSLGNDRYISEKIRKYLSISVSDEEKMSYLLCSRCCEKLANFDNFVNHCMQVQVMFSTLCELIDGDVVDDRLHEIRKEFLHADSEVCKEKPFNYGVSPNISPNIKKRVSVGKDLSPTKARRVDENQKDMPSPKLNNCEDKSPQLRESLINFNKNGRIRPMPELRQAFTDESEILGDSLDSDFNEESFENLLDSEEAFRVLRNSGSDTVFKMKEGNKLNQSPFDSQELSSRLEPIEETVPEKCFQDEKMSAKFSPLKHDNLKPNGNIIRNGNVNNSELHDLSNNINTSCVNSLSDSDMNDFMCDDTEEDEVSDHLGGHSDTKEEVSEPWKNLNEIKPKRSFKPIVEKETKVYELHEMFADDGDEEELGEDSDWNLDEVTDEKAKKRTKSKTTYKCDQCDKSFGRKTLLESHAMSHMPKDQQPFVCCKCARRFHCETLLKNHERSHLPSEEKRVYPCHVCDKKFSRRSAVTAHTKAIHFGERPFVCHMCGNTFSSKATLQEHITIHSDEEPWECTKCSKKFKTKYRLKIHMDTHRETPYSCPHCPLQLSTRRTLRMHLVVHRETKAYQCATCGKAFRRAKDLKSHQNLHTGRRPYTCPFCNRTFANGSNCRSHKRRMHPEELRLYEASLAGNGSVELVNNSTPLELNSGEPGSLVNHDIDEDAHQSMKEDSQDSLLTEMALDLQQPQILTDKSGLTTVDEDPVVTAADLTLAPLVSLSAALPKLEPDDSRLVVMNLTTQMNDPHDSMEAMSPLNLNIMSPMNLNISSPLNLNISSPLNLNISSVLHSPTGRSQQSHSVQSQHHQNQNRYQQPHQPQQQTHLTLQPMQHPTHQQTSQHHLQLSNQSQIHHQMHPQQQVPRSSVQLSTLQTSMNSPTLIHNLSSQTQLPAHLNNTVHHAPQIQTFIPLNQQGTMYNHHNPQEPASSAALVAAAAVAHSMATSTSTSLPPFSSNPYVQHSMAYSRGTNM